MKKDDLTFIQIYNILEDLKAKPQIKNDDVIVSETICHNGDSHKLYYYDNTKLFHCYTNCGTFNIFQLIQKVFNISYKEALDWICSKLNIDINNNTINESTIGWNNLNKLKKIKYNDNISSCELKEYDDTILKKLPHPIITQWEHEGIKREIINSHNIKYNPSNGSIVIPHYDINDRLIGIRERTLIKEKEKYGKYLPAIFHGQMYNHPLGLNLYNLNYSKEKIKEVKKVIVGEGEKFCLSYASMVGKDNDISVASCGSSLSKQQFQLLLHLGINEIILAYDRQFKQIGDEEYQKWIQKLSHLSKKFSPYCVVTFIFDTEGLLDYKDSPVDKGAQIFKELLENRLDYKGRSRK